MACRRYQSNAAGNVFAVSVARTAAEAEQRQAAGLRLENKMDHVAILVEALRRTQAKVAFYLEPGRDHHQGLREIWVILEEEHLRFALQPNSTATLVPGDRAEEVSPAAPLSR